MSDVLTQIVALVAILFGAGGVAALIKARSEARRIDVEALCQAMAAMQTRLDKVQARLDVVERERSELMAVVDRQAARIVDLESEVDSLKRQLRKYEEMERRYRDGTPARRRPPSSEMPPSSGPGHAGD